MAGIFFEMVEGRAEMSGLFRFLMLLR